MANVRKTITRALENSSDGEVSAPHHNIMSKLRLSGCNRREFDTALAALEESGKITVEKTETHTRISAA